MASASTSRLMSELRDVSQQVLPLVFAQPEESDIHHWHALILGPPSTPYSFGMFHFDMRFPSDYPNSPPKVHITTTAGGQVRFNPNLYSTGKVCLSILGTWRAEHSGEQWSAAQSVQSILLSIQSLMHDAPYHNEPSFEEDDGSGDPQKYNHKILHETLRVAVCEVMEETLEQRSVSANGAYPAFSNVRKACYLMYCERHLAEAERMSSVKDASEGAPFKAMPFECPTNGMHGTFQWTKTKARLEAVRKALLTEIEGWRRSGAEQTSLLRDKHDASERLKLDSPDGASIGPSPSNQCVWEATIFGPADSDWDGGMFEVELIFPPDYPESPPYVRFTTQMFHPQISPSGVPYLRSVLLWHCCETKERSIASLLAQLVRLLAADPSPEPATHLNVEAASLRFSRSEAEQKEYKKQVTRKVQRSMDG